MKKFRGILWALLGALLLVSPAWADGFGSKVQLADGVLADNSDLVISKSGATFVGGDVSFTANSQSIIIDTKNIGGVSLTLTGTWTATLQVQWSNKSGSGFTAGRVKDINTGAQSTSITANGNYSAAAGGRYLKLTTTAYTSGTIVVTPVFKSAGFASAVTGGGGLPLVGDGSTVTTSSPLLDLSQTWNNVATTFTFLKGNVTDTASASGSLLMDLQVGGTSQFNVSKSGVVQIGSTATTTLSGNNVLLTLTGGAVPALGVGNNGSGSPAVVLPSTGFLGWNSTTSVTTNVEDVKLYRDAANTLALRNGTNAQTFNVYNTYTDASNYERVRLWFYTNTAWLETTYAGTGTFRALGIAAQDLQFWTGGTRRWNMDSSGHLLANTDNAYDIGASGANRPRNLYLGTRINIAPKTVATLPGSPGDGDRSFVTDATACTFATAVTGGGSVHCPVYYDGGSSSWKAG